MSRLTSPAPDRVPDLLVEQLALGELPPERARAIAARLAAEPGGEARLAALRADDEATLAAHPPARVALGVEARLRAAAAARPARRPWLWPALSVGLAAALALLVLRPPAAPDAPPDPVPTLEDTRPKGPTEPRLAVFREGPHDAERLADGATVAPGDKLQLGYLAAGAAHGVLLSLDGRGEVTLHFPDRPGADTTLASPEAVTLPHAYELDDAPDFERFFLITAAAPLDPAALLDAARRLAAAPDRGERAPLALPAPLRVTSLLLAKEAQR